MFQKLYCSFFFVCSMFLGKMRIFFEGKVLHFRIILKFSTGFRIINIYEVDESRGKGELILAL